MGRPLMTTKQVGGARLGGGVERLEGPGEHGMVDGKRRTGVWGGIGLGRMQADGQPLMPTKKVGRGARPVGGEGSEGGGRCISGSGEVVNEIVGWCRARKDACHLLWVACPPDVL